MSSFEDHIREVKEGLRGVLDEGARINLRPVEEALRLIEVLERDLLYAQGERKAAQDCMLAAISKLGAVTACLWPMPVKRADGRVFDGSPEMKIQAHDTARWVANS